ncbi:unnamed protein product [Prorocentrum cordatum]|uniref:Uncharacterized protein n=1 Tax=Prorocentrum cordatum TaxID=2364126 RepID=A0ABN9UG26_9DINO|nr:unnamed protein product [Polarella glacialis]
MYVPLLLDAAGQLDGQEGAAWRQHPAAAHWWENAAAGYVQPIAQDIVMQIFGGGDFIRAVEQGLEHRARQTRAEEAPRTSRRRREREAPHQAEEGEAQEEAEDEEALEEAEGAEAPEEAEGEQAAESAFPDAAWALLDAVDLEAELRWRVPCIRAPPAFLRGRLRQLYHTVLEEVLRADALPGDADGLQKVRAWKLLLAMDEDETLELQAAVAERYARAEIPASAHDRGLQEALHDLLDLDPAPAEAERLSRVSSLPLGLGGLGLRSAARTAECAYWASWVDALPMLRQRNPTAATELTATLAGTGATASCLQEAERARAAAARDGFATCPTWQEVWGGARPEQTEPEPGEWKHGWQYHASAARDRRYREEVVLPSLTDDQQWMLDSQGGRCSGRHLALIPSTPESTFTPERFRALLQRRPRLPLDATASRCNGRSCQAHLDERGDHRAACPRSGRLLKRRAPIERMWARVCREAGGRVRTDVFLRDMNLPGIAANDGRCIEVVANGLPAYHGRQLAIDACIVSPLRATGRPIARRLRPGLALKRARRRKQTTCPELVGWRRGYLLVAGAETGGRWDEEAFKLLVTLARAQRPAAAGAATGGGRTGGEARRPAADLRQAATGQAPRRSAAAGGGAAARRPKAAPPAPPRGRRRRHRLAAAGPAAQRCDERPAGDCRRRAGRRGTKRRLAAAAGGGWPRAPRALLGRRGAWGS